MRLIAPVILFMLLTSGLLAQDSGIIPHRFASGNDSHRNSFAGYRIPDATDTGGFLGALRLHSGGDYADIPSATQLSPSQVTLEAWVNLEGATGEQTLIDKRDATGGYNLRIVGDGYPLGIAVVMKGQTEDILSVGGLLQPLTWYHIAATYDNNTIRLYLDGNPVGSLGSTRSIGNTSSTLRIGEYLGYPSGSLMLHGMIDEVRIWNRALSQAEITSTMSSLLVGKEPGLAGYWSFDERNGTEVIDGSEFANNGALVGKAVIVPSTAPVGDEVLDRAARIDQAGAMAEVAPASVLSPTQITIECWLNKDSTINAGECTVLDKRGATNGYNLRLAGTSFPLGLFFVVKGGGAEAITGTGNCINSHIWYHVAATYDGQTASLYLDGKLIASQNVAMDISQSPSPLLIGEFLGPPGAYHGIYGDLDELRIWNYARSQSDIQSHMHKELSGMESGLMGYWRFNESSGTVAHDKTVNENNATLSNGATFVPSNAPVSFVPPTAPIGFRAWGSDNQVLLRWQPVQRPGIRDYVIYRGSTNNFNPAAADSLTTASSVTTSYSDASVGNGAQRFYRIKTVDSLNHDSRFSPEVVGKASPIYDNYFIGAYYYPWYSNTWGHQWPGQFVRDYLVPPQAPALGQYDCRDPSVIRQHLDWCKTYGIKLLVCSWWGPNSREDITIRDSFKPGLKSDDVSFALFYESMILGNPPFVIDASMEARLTSDYTYIANTYFSHPNYLRINNRPVVFIYLSYLYQGSYLQAFDNIRQSMRKLGYELFLVGDEMGAGAPSDHMNFLNAATGYGISPGLGYGIDQDFFGPLSGTFSNWEQGTAARGLQFVPDVMPGFNNRKMGGTSTTNSNVIPRQSTAGASQTSYYEESINISRPYVDPNLKLIMITSWNEWHEDTQIEPTNVAAATNKDNSASTIDYTNGYYYDGYGTKFLEVTRDLLARKMVNVTPSENASPLRFSLEQNFPNPFNPATTIRYCLPHKSQVLLSVYNTLGQLVATLVQGQQEAGSSEVKFEGSALASGVYFCRIQAGEFVASKRMLVLK